MSNYIRHPTTQRYHIIYVKIFCIKKILKIWLNVSNQYVRETTSVQVSMKPMRCLENSP